MPLMVQTRFPQRVWWGARDETRCALDVALQLYQGISDPRTPFELAPPLPGPSPRLL